MYNIIIHIIIHIVNNTFKINTKANFTNSKFFICIMYNRIIHFFIHFSVYLLFIFYLSKPKNQTPL